MHQVFVYGTLKKGEPNHNWLTDKMNGISSFIGDAKTKNKYPLIIATRYNIPFLLYKPGSGHSIKGEVYSVDDSMLAKLDELEGHPEYYERELDDIMLNEGGKDEKLIKCWVYFLKKFRNDLLKLPQMDNYRSSGEHGLPYKERSSRDPKYNYIVEIRDI